MEQASSINMAMALDILLIALLTGTIIFSFILWNTLSKIREGRSEMKKLVKELSEAVMRAEGAISGMKNTAHKCNQDIRDHARMAEELLDELKFISDRGNSVAEQLVTAVEAGRNARPTRAETVAQEYERKEAKGRKAPSFSAGDPVLDVAERLGDKRRSKMERELADALKQLKR